MQISRPKYRSPIGYKELGDGGREIFWKVPGSADGHKQCYVCTWILIQRRKELLLNQNLYPFAQILGFAVFSSVSHRFMNGRPQRFVVVDKQWQRTCNCLRGLVNLIDLRSQTRQLLAAPYEQVAWVHDNAGWGCQTVRAMPSCPTDEFERCHWAWLCKHVCTRGYEVWETQSYIHAAINVLFQAHLILICDFAVALIFY